MLGGFGGFEGAAPAATAAPDVAIGGAVPAAGRIEAH